MSINENNIEIEHYIISSGLTNMIEGCSFYSQIDRVYACEYIFKNGEPHLLEVNTVPGLTKASILPQQAAVAGISLLDLFSNAIEEALK